MKALRVYLQWLILLACLLALGFILQHYHVPAALLLGPMMVGLVMALSGARLAISPKVFIGCQAILGCMIAGALLPSILVVLVSDWLPVVLTLTATLLASGLSGWLLVRFRRLLGQTGAWGSSPGGSSVMVAMAGDFGADVRLVAFMQYLRVLFVATAAVAHIALGEQGAAAPAVQWFPPLDFRFVATLVVVAVGTILGRRLHIPACPLLLSMVAGATLHATGTLTLQVAEWLLALA